MPGPNPYEFPGLDRGAATNVIERQPGRVGGRAAPALGEGGTVMSQSSGQSIPPDVADADQGPADRQIGAMPETDLLDPASYPPAATLTRRCDLVMKGGITSGVIYPHAVCQLATTRRLHRVGGTSAGAIAAAAAAAAELGRDTGRPDAGYPRLASLPTNLAAPVGGGHTRLFHLFQPQAATAPLYRLVAVLIGRGGTAAKAVRGILAAVRLLRPLPALAMLVVPLALLAATVVQGAAWGIVAAALLVVVGLLVGVVWSLVARLGHDLPRNQLGLCSGMRAPRSTQPALTEWLSDEFDRIAGKAPGDDPLTFGDLAAGGIELAMLTTDLSAGTQNQLPFRSRVWAFDPTEFRQLFPERIVEWMIAHPPEARDTDDEKVFAAFGAAGLHPLPLAEHLPVIVCVRMSLSFPVLLSTVALHAFDYTRSQPAIVRHRFSDGGITSNFPIHFFDAAVPNQPTFGINLAKTDQADPDPTNNVSMPDFNRNGILARAHPVETFGQFVAALKDSVQNWSDSMQTRVPGYRDRIVVVKHTKSEGGMNLDMDGQVVLDLARRGRAAGHRAEHFDFVNHRWVRLRSFLHTLEELVVPAARTIDTEDGPDGVPTYREMIAGSPPTSYRRAWSADKGNSVADAIAHLADAYDAARNDTGDSSFEQGAPAPRPHLQVRPKP
jgi:hypothetical protein